MDPFQWRGEEDNYDRLQVLIREARTSILTRSSKERTSSPFRDALFREGKKGVSEGGSQQCTSLPEIIEKEASLLFDPEFFFSSLLEKKKTILKKKISSSNAEKEFT